MNKQARLAYGIRVSNSILRTVNGVLWSYVGCVRLGIVDAVLL